MIHKCVDCLKNTQSFDHSLNQLNSESTNFYNREFPMQNFDHNIFSPQNNTSSLFKKEEED